MKKDEKDILEGLQKKGEQFKLPVEPGIWDAIEAEINPNKKKKRVGFWWRLGIFASILTVLLFSLNLIFGFGQVDDGQLSFNPEEQGKAPYITEFKNFESTIPFNNSTNNDEILLSTEDPAFIEENPTEKPNNRIHPSTENPVQKFSSDDRDNLSEYPKNDLLNVANQELIPEREVAEINDESTVREESNENQPDTPEISNLEVEEEKDTTEAIEPNRDTQDEPELNPNAPDSVDIEAKPDDNRSKFSVLVFGGIGSSFRTLQSDANALLITHKNDHETFGNTFDLGIVGQFNLTSRFYLRAGIEYKFYSDRYDFQHDIVTHTTKNDYQYLQVPVNLGYNLFQTDKMGLNVFSGMKWNLLYKAQSSWVDPGLLVPVAHNNQGVNTPFRKSTFAVNIVLDYNWSISDKLKFHLLPGADIFVSSVYKRNTDINQRPFSLNADFGFSYHF